MTDSIYDCVLSDSEIEEIVAKYREECAAASMRARGMIRSVLQASPVSDAILDADLKAKVNELRMVLNVSPRRRLEAEVKFWLAERKKEEQLPVDIEGELDQTEEDEAEDEAYGRALQEIHDKLLLGDVEGAFQVFYTLTHLTTVLPEGMDPSDVHWTDIRRGILREGRDVGHHSG